jgi:tetratricopeptide (TPR) repeat protein
MARNSHFQRRCRSAILVLGLIASYPQSGFAVTDASTTTSYADLSKLEQSEQVLFGYTRKNIPSQERLQSMEIEIFGERHQGSFHSRIEAIQAALASGKSNLLMPPMAAELDKGASDSGHGSAAAIGNAPQGNDDRTAEAAEDNAKSQLRQALGLYSAGKYPEAEAAFKKVIALDKNNTDAYFNLGAMAENRGDLKSALTYYQTALKINPSDGELQNAVAGARSKLADLTITPTVSAEMPQPAPSYTKAQVRVNIKERIDQASIAYKSGNYDQSIQILRSVAQESPNEASVQYALSQCFKAKHQYMEARSTLNVALNLDPANQLYKDALGDLDRRIANGGGDRTQKGYDTIANNGSADPAAASGPAGQITPFTGISSPHTGWQSTGSPGGYSASGGYLPSFSRGGFGGSSSRIQRAAIGGLAGVAVGSLFGGGYRGRTRNMMIGGAVGGLFGLLSGR